MAALLIRLAQVVMGGICALLVLSIVAPFRALSIPEVTFQAPAQAGASTEVAAFPRYAIIGSRNLFQTPTVAPLVPVQELIEESKIRAKVVGTVAAIPEALSYAVLESGQAQRQVLEIGDEVEPGVVIARIERRRVVVQNRGRLEALSMEDDAAPKSLALLRSGRPSVAKIYVEPPAASAYRAVAGGTQREPKRPAEPRPSPAPPARDVASRSQERERRPLSTPSTPEFLTAEQAQRLIEGFGTRQGAGFTAISGPVAMANEGDFSAVAGEQLLRNVIDRASLSEGEQVLAVNGVPVDDEGRLGELLAGLAQGGPARLKIAVNSTTEREIEVQLP